MSPKSVSLRGRAYRESRPGPPGFGETPKIDKRLVSTILRLDHTIYVCGDSNSSSTPGREPVREVELIFNKWKPAARILRSEVSVTGVLSEGLLATDFRRIQLLVTQLHVPNDVGESELIYKDTLGVVGSRRVSTREHVTGSSSFPMPNSTFWTEAQQLVMQYVSLDAAGGRFEHDPWFNSVITDPELEPTYDSFTVIDSVSTRVTREYADSVFVGVTYYVVGRSKATIGPDGSKGHIIVPTDTVETVTFPVIRTWTGMLIESPRINQHVYSTSIKKAHVNQGQVQEVL